MKKVGAPPYGFVEDQRPAPTGCPVGRTNDEEGRGAAVATAAAAVAGGLGVAPGVPAAPAVPAARRWQRRRRRWPAASA
ncbi:hypothetical protein [Mycobacterium tuberculosis]|uniref:hypothetical protein n=1 Tax=Mycobacterium tuberculosis TaxID=1773 RepID=UPI0027121E40|nr:hypothetical protein [Mycobacterium tuberculosis]